MIKKFKSGKSYKLREEGFNHIVWNGDGKMDFLKDGKPHRCKIGGRYLASFFDSPSPDREWAFPFSLEYFDEVEQSLISLLEE